MRELVVQDSNDNYSRLMQEDHKLTASPRNTGERPPDGLAN